MAKYIVTVPYRGEQTYVVEARSAAEAMRKAEYGEDAEFGVQPLDFRVVTTYKPSSAVLDDFRPIL